MKRSLFTRLNRVILGLMLVALMSGCFVVQSPNFQIAASDFTDDIDSAERETDKRKLEEPILYRFDTGEEIYKGNSSYRPYSTELYTLDLKDGYEAESKVQVYTKLPKDLSRGGVKSGDELHIVDVDLANMNNYSIYDEEGTYFTENIYYNLNYNGTGILIQTEDVDNDKLMYAIVSPGDSKLKWKLVENKVKVTATYEYEYTRLIPLNNWSSFVNNPDYNPNAPVNDPIYKRYKYLFGDTDIFSDKTSKNLVSANLEKDLGLGGLFVNKYSDGEAFELYIPEETDYGDHFTVPAGSALFAKKEKLTFKKEIEFWYIDTSHIYINQKDMDVHVKWLKSGATVDEVEKYRFSQSTKSKLKVTYKYTDGFTVSGMIPRQEFTTEYRTNLYNVFTNEGTEYVLKWKTAMMQGWYETSPNTINQDIPIEYYNVYGATLYFMDVCSPTKIVSVKIPKRPDPPKLTVKIDKKGELYAKGVKKKKHQLRAWYYYNGDVVYINIPETIGAKYSVGSSDGSEWYDYVGGSSLKISELIAKIPKAHYSSEIECPEFFIETRVAPTDKKPASEVSVTYFAEQYTFETSLSKGVTFTFETGKIRISDAGNNNAYEYKLSDTGKWKTIKTGEFKDKGIADGVVVYIRKKAKTSSSKTVTLYSTTCKLELDIKENKPSCVYKLVDGELVKQ